MYRRLSRTLLTALLAVLTGVLAGCDNTIEPFSEAGAYSVYGNLCLADQAHFFRVKPLNRAISSQEPLDVTVTLTNQSDGTTRTLRDSVIVFDGTPTHNYWTAFRPEPSTAYELTVEREDGTGTRAQATTPTAVDPAVVPSEPETCRTEVRVIFRDAVAPRAAAVGFRYEGTMYWVSRSPSIGPLPDRETQGLRFTPQSILATEVPGRLGESRCVKLNHDTLYVRFVYTGSRSIESGVGLNFDPTESRQVTNGTGFFGTVRRDTVTLTVDTTLAEVRADAPRSGAGSRGTSAAFSPGGSAE